MDLRSDQVTRKHAAYVLNIADQLSQIAGGEKADYAFSGTVEELEKLIETPYYEGLVFYIDGEEAPIAYVSYSLNLMVRKCRLNMCFSDFWVNPEYRGKGIGQAIIKQLKSIANDKNCYTLEFFVAQENEKAREFFSRIGACNEPAQPMYIRM